MTGAAILVPRRPRKEAKVAGPWSDGMRRRRAALRRSGRPIHRPRIFAGASRFWAARRPRIPPLPVRPPSASAGIWLVLPPSACCCCFGRTRMTFVLSLLSEILHIGLMIVAAPTVAGVLDWLDARLSGRSGPPILLPWRDLVRLSRKAPVTVESVSAVSRLAPALGLGATLSAAALVPSFTLGMALAPLADVLVIVSLLAVARVAAGLAALDSGAALPGLAAQNASASRFSRSRR